MAEAASSLLNNTPALARSSYIHPDIVALAEAPETLAAALRRSLAGVSGLRAEEERLLRFLENRRNARRRARRKAS
jgi:DNA topoisomerase-1